MSEHSSANQDTRGEWPQFMVLVIISIGLIVVIALLRPLIFNRIVPAILGPDESKTDTTIPAPVIDEKEAIIDQEGSTSSESVDESNSDQTEENNGVDETEETDSEENEAIDPDEATMRTHTVITGETVHQIARLYNVPADKIIAANNLTNPNVLRIGQKLVIPTE